MSGAGAFAFLRDSILKWHADNPRSLPWKETDDPYKIWLSEIMLQQTRVSQGIPYYKHFIKKYPSVFDLAAATEAEVLKDWQGLGYNGRARNMRKAAITVCEELHGYFPKTYNDLIMLQGVGPYTAAAIASFAFGEQVPVIDANVIRLLCRFVGIEDDPSSRAVRIQMKSVLDDAMSGTDPAEFNQAIMNFGALQCVPKNPDCTVCPLNDGCFAHNSGRVVDLPRKKARKARNTRYFHYLVITSETGVVMRHRTDKDIWQGMYDFPLRELSEPSLLSQQDLHDWVFSHTAEGPFSFESPIQDKQILTHQNIVCVFYPCLVNRPDKTSFSSGVFFVDFRNLHKFAVPKIIDCYFRVKSILL